VRGTEAGAAEATTSVLSMAPEEMGAVLHQRWGQPSYRGQQLFEALWRRGVEDYDQAASLPKELRRQLAAAWPLERAAVERVQTAADGTEKLLVRLSDGERVETVLLPHPYGTSVCVSTQVGCAMGCRFCASGLFGRRRQLAAGEMLEQVRLAAARAAGQGRRITHVDLMGIGEPLDNYAQTVRFLRLVHHPRGFAISYRRITVSTSGLVPRIHALAREGLPVTLAISLHAPRDDLRTRLMPVNRAYPLAALLAAAAEYFRASRRRITFEYALLAGVNDGEREARELVDCLRALPPQACHVNLIPWNPVPEHPFRPSPPEAVRRFLRIVQAAGISCTIRKELGQAIDAACGQLRRRGEADGNLQPGRLRAVAPGDGAQPKSGWLPDPPL
jgi:23S rRNA (adenine2503-C2)-methyltransferase